MDSSDEFSADAAANERANKYRHRSIRFGFHLLLICNHAALQVLHLLPGAATC